VPTGSDRADTGTKRLVVSPVALLTYASFRVSSRFNAQRIQSVASYLGRRAQDRMPIVHAAPPRYGWIALCVLAFIASLWFLSWAKELLIPLCFAVFITACFSPAVRWLARWRIPHALGAALLLIAVCWGFATAVHRTSDQLIEMVDQMPAATRHLHHEIDAALNKPGSMAHRLKILMDLPRSGEAAAAHADAPAAAAAAVPPAAGAVLQASLAQDTLDFMSIAGEIGAVVFLIYLMLSTGGWLESSIARLQVIPDDARACVRAAIVQTQHALHRYLAWLALTNVLLGLAVWGAFRIWGMHFAAAWGFAAGLLHFVPYFGPTVIALGSGLFAAEQFDSLATGLMVAGTTVALSALIGVVLQTWLSGRSAQINTVSMFVSVLFWSWIWGLPGLVLAGPLTILIKAICSEIPGLRWFDSILSSSEDRRKAAFPRRSHLSAVGADGATRFGGAPGEVNPPPG
jgi:predicted PurR-regulated permease PerM